MITITLPDGSARQVEKGTTAMQVALSNYLITFFGLPIAAIWIGERLGSQAITGGILVLASTLLITIADYKMSQKHQMDRIF